MAAEQDWLCDAVRAATAGEALVVDLSTRPEFAVVKVVVPRVGFDRDIVHPDRSAAAVTRLFAGRIR